MLGDGQTARSSYAVSDVVGELDPDMLMVAVEDKCEASLLSIDASSSQSLRASYNQEHVLTHQHTAGSFPVIDDLKPRVIRIDFPRPSSSTDRHSQLNENDAFLSSLLDLLPSQKYTVLYTTSPVTAADHLPLEESVAYRMESTFPSSLHVDLKRDFGVHERAGGENITLPHGALFERYQFLTPGKLIKSTPNQPGNASDYQHPCRHLHGPFRRPSTAIHPLHWNQRSRKFASIICSIR